MAPDLPPERRLTSLGAEEPESSGPRSGECILLRTLGRGAIVAVDATGAERVLSRAAKPVALLALLASTPRRGVRRDWLVEMLWPDRPTERGRHALRQQLVNVRKLIGGDALIVADEEIFLGPNVTDDRSVLLLASRRGDPDGVLAAYGGVFLPDLSGSGGVDFQHWCDAERRTYAALFAHAATARIPLFIGEQALEAAVGLAFRLRDTSPEDESFWRTLLETLVRTGRLLDARIEAEALEASAAAEGRELGRVTLALIRRVRTAVASPLGQPNGEIGDTPPFVGRERVMSRLHTRWQRASHGRTEIVTISAGPGIGKTRVLNEFRRRASADGGRVVSVVAHTGERTLPFALLGDLALQLGQLPGAGGVGSSSAGIVVGLAPSLSSYFATASAERPHATERSRIVHAMTEFVRCVADEKPLLLLIDDWHWADPESAQTIAALLRRLEGTSVLAILASRVSAEADVSQDEALVLEPLTLGDTAAMLADFGPVPAAKAEEFVALLHEGSRGSPLLALHLLRHAREQGWIALGETWEIRHLDALRMAVETGGALESRIGELPDACLTLLRLIALDGVPVERTVLERLGGFDGATVEAVLPIIEQRGFIEYVAGAWQVAHDEVARAATQPLDQRDLAVLSLQLGEAYAAAALAGGGETRWRRAAVHLLAAGAEDRLVELLRNWGRAERAAGERLTRPRLAAALGAGTPASVVSRAVPMLTARTRRWIPIAMAIPVLAAMVPLVSGGRILADGRATHLVIENFPVALAPETVAAPIDVALVDARGRTIVATGDSVHVIAVGNGRVMHGGSTAVVDGRARFAELVVKGAGAAQLRFTATGLPPIVSDTVHLGPSDAASTLRLVAGRLAGTSISPASPVIRIDPGDRITGTVDLRYTSGWDAANIVLASATTWRAGPAGCRHLAPLATPTRNSARRVSIEETGPTAPGSYYIVLAFMAEDGANSLCSGTNWTYGRQVWGDGNDLSEWGEAQAREAAEKGQVKNGFLTMREGRELRAVNTVPAVMIRVVVGTVK